MGKNGTNNKKQGPGYLGVDPAAECIIHSTSKFAVWEAPGVSQPPPPTGCKFTAVKAANKEHKSNVNIKQTQNPNGKFLTATPSEAAPTPTTTTAAPTTGKGMKNFPPTIQLECSCGEVMLSLPGPPVKRLECCCVDCRFGLQWCQEKWNPEEKFEDLSVDLVYFANCLQVDQGGEQLQAYMIKEGYNTKRVVASCCGTPLLGDHPFYQAQKLVTYMVDTNYHVTCQNCELIPIQTRIFESDLTKEEKQKLEPLEKPDEEVYIQEPDLNQWKAQHPRYTTIQRLIGSIGPLQYMDPHFQGKEPEWNRQMRLASASGN